MESISARIVLGYPPRASVLAPWAQLLEKAGRAILAFVARHAEARRARATANQLASLSPRQLADIGLTRADVDMMTNAVPRDWLEQRDRVLYL